MSTGVCTLPCVIHTTGYTRLEWAASINNTYTVQYWKTGAKSVYLLWEVKTKLLHMAKRAKDCTLVDFWLDIRYGAVWYTSTITNMARRGGRKMNICRQFSSLFPGLRLQIGARTIVSIKINLQAIGPPYYEGDSSQKECLGIFLKLIKIQQFNL